MEQTMRIHGKYTGPRQTSKLSFEEYYREWDEKKWEERMNRNEEVDDSEEEEDSEKEEGSEGEEDSEEEEHSEEDEYSMEEKDRLCLMKGSPVAPKVL